MRHGQMTFFRGAWLLIALVVAAMSVACGRANENEINQALGITPTPTVSAEQIATGTAEAAATGAARTAVAVARAATPGSGGDTEVAVAAGDVTRGRLQFLTQCQGCHNPAGIGGNLLAAGGPGAGLTNESLFPLIREGTGHPSPPGAFPATLVSDGNIRDLAAFIQSQAGG